MKRKIESRGEKSEKKNGKKDFKKKKLDPNSATEISRMTIPTLSKTFTFIFSKRATGKGMKEKKRSIFLNNALLLTSTDFALRFDLPIIKGQIKDEKLPLMDFKLSAHYLIEWHNQELAESKSVKDLKKEYNLKRPKKSIKKNRNERIQKEKQKIYQKGILLAKKGYQREYIASFLGIKKNALNYAFWKDKQNAPQFPQKQGRKTIMKRHHLNFLIETFEKNKDTPFFLVNDIKKELVRQYPEFQLKCPSFATIKRAIYEVGYTWKKCQLRSSMKNPKELLQLRYKLAIEISHYMVAGKKLIFIDETGFSLYKSQYYGFSPKNNPKQIKLGSFGTNISAAVAISNEGLVGMQLFEGSINGEDFGAFMMQILEKNDHIKNNLSDYVFFMDNCKIHKTKKIQQFYENLYVVFNAPYSPMLNPIEEIFGLVKRAYRKNYLISKEKPTNHILNSFKGLKIDTYRRTIRKSIKFVILSLQSQEI